jgi:hypothetical protein
MKPEDFENELRNIPWRELPAVWKTDILGQSLRPSTPPIKPVRVREAFSWHEWLWPRPAAWAGLAAVWVAVLALHWTAPDQHRATPMDFSAAPTESAPGLELALIEQRKLRDELLGITDARDEESSSEESNDPAETRPRSDVAPNRATA